VSHDNGKTPAEQAMEVFVYAPIGLLFEGSTILPQLVERGRNQVNMARMIGKFAVEQGRSEAAKTASKLGDQAAGLLDFLGDSMTPATDAPPSPPAKRPPGRRPATSGRAMAAAKTSAKPAAAKAPASPAPATTTPEPAQADTSVEVASLAITDYDGLSASHVVNRLAGLSAEELDAVRRYEAANRGRKTILSKIAQLQSR
jgi:hypothetical protein